ncbi:MAG: SMC-Scp complex subunit ScpB [Clostridia bacterium]|nr:SMC-Scp complex subunit ScpB [Clostridia bacterium]
MDNLQKTEEIQKIDKENLEKAIEAILFAAGHPMSYEKLGEVLGYFSGQIKKKVFEMAEKYNSDENRGIMLLTFDQTCQLCTKEDFLPYIKAALGIRRGGNLSSSSLEVLAIIAYNQPTTRAFIDEVRGVDSAYIVGSLLEKSLIEVCGRLDVPGRPNLYRTTPTFLRCFGIETLEQLPYVEIQRAQNEGEIIPLDLEFMDEGASAGDAENASEDNDGDTTSQSSNDDAVDDFEDISDSNTDED